MKLTSIRISRETHERLKKIKKETGLSVRVLIDKAVPIIEERWKNDRLNDHD